MTPDRRSAAVVAAAAVACFLVSAATKGDPLLVVEVGGTILVAAWGAFAVLLVGRSAALARDASRAGVPRRVAGVDCRVVHDRRPQAFVAGGWRPTIFVTTGVFEVLAAEELRAVMLHEAHHARTRAPLRAALVDAWGGVARRAPRLGALAAARLAAMEIEADRAALAAGVMRRHLAQALLKLDAAPHGVAFAGGGERRLRALLDVDATATPTAPVEWLPLLVVVGFAVGCRLAGTSLGV